MHEEEPRFGGAFFLVFADMRREVGGLRPGGRFFFGSSLGFGLAGLRGVGRWGLAGFVGRGRRGVLLAAAHVAFSFFAGLGRVGCCSLAAAGFWFFAGCGLGWPSGSWSLKALQGSLAAGGTARCLLPLSMACEGRWGVLRPGGRWLLVLRRAWAWLAFGELVAEGLAGFVGRGGAARWVLPLSLVCEGGGGVAAWRPLASGSSQGVGLAGLRGVGREGPCGVR